MLATVHRILRSESVLAQGGEGFLSLDEARRETIAAKLNASFPPLSTPNKNETPTLLGLLSLVLFPASSLRASETVPAMQVRDRSESGEREKGAREERCEFSSVSGSACSCQLVLALGAPPPPLPPTSNQPASPPSPSPPHPPKI